MPKAVIERGGGGDPADTRPRFSDSQDTRSEAARQAGMTPATRPYPDSRETYEVGGGADASSQTYQSDVSRINNDRFNYLVENPAGRVSAGMVATNGRFAAAAQQAADTAAVTGLRSSPPVGFQYKPWMDSHPLIAKAGLESGLGAEDWKILDRHFRAEEATKTLMLAARMPGTNQLEISYAGLDIDIRALALKNLYDFVSNVSDSPDPSLENDPDAEGPGFWQQAWDSTVGPGYRAGWDNTSAAFSWVYDNKDHAIRAAKEAQDQALKTGEARFLPTQEDWAATETGAMDKPTVAKLQAEHGAQRVDMVVAIAKAYKDHPEDPWGQLLPTYQDNPEFFKAMEMFMLEDRRDSEFTSLIDGIQGASNDNLGNMYTRDIFGAGDSDSFRFKATSIAINAAAAVTTDPLMYVGTVVKSVRLAKYGLTRLAYLDNAGKAGTAWHGSIDKMMSRRGVNNWFTGMGEDAARFAQSTDELEKAALRARMLQREEAWQGGRQAPIKSSFEKSEVALETPEAVAVRRARKNMETSGMDRGPAEAEMGTIIVPSEEARGTTLTDEIINNKLYTPEKAAEWIKSGEGLELILNGQSAMKNPMIPRTSLGGSLLESMPGRSVEARVARMSNPRRDTGGGTIRSKPSTTADAIFTSDMTGASVAEGLTRNARALGREIGVSGDPKRLIAGKGRIPVGIHLWQEGRRRGLVYAMSMTDKSLAARADRLARWAEKAPMKQSLHIMDGRDAKYVGQWARFAGLQKQHVQALEYVWTYATAAERRRIAQGLSKTTAHALGIESNDGVLAKEFFSNLVDGMSVGTQYGTGVRRSASGLTAAEGRAVLAGDRLAAAGGEITLSERQRTLARRMWQLADERRQAQRDLFAVQDEIRGLTGQRRAEGRLMELQQELENLKAVMIGSTEELYQVVRMNGREGAHLARTIGLEALNLSQAAGAAAVRDTLAGVRAAGVDAVRDVRGVAGETAQAAREGANSTARQSVAQVRKAAKKKGARESDEVRAAASGARENIARERVGAQELDSYVGDAAAAARSGIRDTAVESGRAGRQSIQDVGAAGREDIRAAGALQYEANNSSLAEIRSLSADLKSVQRKLKKLSGSGTKNADYFVLAARADKIDARLEELKRAANIGRWNVTNLMKEEEFQRRIAAGTDELVTYNPSIIDGVSHAMHVRQTADRIRMPDLVKLQQFSQRTGYVDALLGMSYTNWATNIVDVWSLLTLMGPRYALRNGIEDLIFYNIAGGRGIDLRRGARASNAIRDAEGRYPGLLSAVGGVVMSKWKPFVSKAEVRAAADARKAGDKEAWKLLVARGMARGRIKSLGITTSKEIEAQIDQLLSAGFADDMMAHIAETSRDTMARGGTISGGMHADEVGLVSMSAYDKSLTTKVGLPAERPVYRNVKITDEGGYDAWWTAIHDFVEGDGALGQAAIKGIDQLSKTGVSTRTFVKDEIVQRLANIVEKNSDKPWSYSNRFSMVDATSPKQFAARYLDEALTVFSNEAGVINKDLVSRLLGRTRRHEPGGLVTYIDNPELAGRAAVKDVIDGKEKYRVHPNDLVRDYSSPSDRPYEIVGPEFLSVPEADVMSGPMDAIWRTLGDQYNRISKQPMFLGRYIEQRAELKSYELMLADQFSPGVAEKVATRMAADRAYELIYNFTDNPGNRTMLAWNTRNIARYYRATEDFYRKAVRSVKFYPERVLRDALVLHVLDDAGFMHEDDQGNKFFLYPNDIPVLSPLLKMLNVDILVPTSPTRFKGQFNMLTPSGDPAAWLPTFSGPLLAVPIATLTGVWAPFEEFQKLTLGDKSLGRPLVDVIFPAPVAAAFNLLSKDDLAGKYANNLRTVIMAFAANGDIPDPTTADREKVDLWMHRVNQAAQDATLLQFGMRFFVPASPTAVANVNTSDQFAASGVGNLRSAFIKLVNYYDAKKEVEPFKAALMTWWKISPDLSIYTVSKSGDPSTANVSITDDGSRWIMANKDLVDISPDAAGYLIPQSGDFTMRALRMYRAYGMNVPKSSFDFAENVLVSGAKTAYFATRDDAIAKITAETDPDKQKQLRKDFSDWKNGYTDAQGKYHEGFLEQNPLLAIQLKTSDTAVTKGSVLEKLNNTDGKRDGLFQVIADTRPEMFTSDPSLQTMWDMVDLYQRFQVDLESVQGTTDKAQNLKRKWKDNMISVLTEKANGDQRALLLYQSLMEPNLTVDVL